MKTVEVTLTCDLCGDKETGPEESIRWDSKMYWCRLVTGGWTCQFDVCKKCFNEGENSREKDLNLFRRVWRKAVSK